MRRQSPGGRVLIIVPAWNEENSVGRTVGEIRSALPDLDVLVVDDGSTDLTAATAKEAGAVVLPLSYNAASGAAIGTAPLGTAGAVPTGCGC